jgi:hypothetical protein
MPSRSPITRVPDYTSSNRKLAMLRGEAVILCELGKSCPLGGVLDLEWGQLWAYAIPTWLEPNVTTVDGEIRTVCSRRLRNAARSW